MNNWIPVEKELPQKGQKVLISSKVFGVISGIYDDMVDIDDSKEYKFLTHYSLDSADYASIDAVAWQPLPDPYEENDNNAPKYLMR